MNYYLSKAVTSIGRESGNDISVPGDSQVSRHHAEIRREGGAYVLYDRSTNGTFVGGRRVTQTALKDGDQIKIGGASLVYQGGALFLSGGARASSGGGSARAGGPPPPPWQGPPAQQGGTNPLLIALVGVVVVAAIAMVTWLLVGRDANVQDAEDISKAFVSGNVGWIRDRTYEELRKPIDLLPEWPDQTLKDVMYEEVSDQGNWSYAEAVKRTEGVYDVTATLGFGVTDASTGNTSFIEDVYVFTVDTYLQQVKDIDISYLATAQ